MKVIEGARGIAADIVTFVAEGQQQGTQGTRIAQIAQRLHNAGAHRAPQHFQRMNERFHGARVANSSERDGGIVTHGHRLVPECDDQRLHARAHRRVRPELPLHAAVSAGAARPMH